MYKKIAQCSTHCHGQAHSFIAQQGIPNRWLKDGKDGKAEGKQDLLL